jgi:hypothetical protein
MDHTVSYWLLAKDPRRLWYRTVEEYSLVKLTFEKDKLAALAALAQRMEGIRVNDNYLTEYGRKHGFRSRSGKSGQIRLLEG